MKSYLTPEEYDQVVRHAGLARLSVSSYAKAMCLGFEPKSNVDHEAVLAMLQVNRDLSRLGNLLKLALDQSDTDNATVAELLISIQETKILLNEKVKAI